MRQEQGRFGGPEVGKFTGFSEQYFSTPTPDRPRQTPEKSQNPKSIEEAISHLERNVRRDQENLNKRSTRRLIKPNTELEKPLFINGYNGNFAQDMAFDEIKIGRALSSAS